MEEKNLNTEEEQQKADEMAAEAAVDNVAEQTAGQAGPEQKADEQAEEQEGEAAEQDPEEKVQSEIEELKRQLLYKAAEFDNYRKRTLKEKADLILNGGEKAITAMLPVVDDMERAIANADKTDDAKVLKEGMEMIYQKMVKTLETLGVHAIETKDADFDTDIHDAIAMIPAPNDDMKGKVLDCVEKGYKLNEKVIRHAKVAVGQ